MGHYIGVVAVAALERQEQGAALVVTPNFYYLRQGAAGLQPAAGTGRPANGGGRRQKPAGAGGARGGTPGEATGARE